MVLNSSTTLPPDRLLRWLLVWTALTTVIFWLPTIRGPFDGTSYEWQLFGHGGLGVQGDYWFPLLGSALALLLQWLGWRGGRAPFHLLLVAWHAFLAFFISYFAASAPESMRLRGDTLGIDLSLTVLGPLLFSAWFALAIYWVIRDLRQPPGRARPVWTRKNTVWLTALLVLLPVQFVLLRFGEPGSVNDQLGVLLTIGQWLLIGRALRPYRASP